MVNQPKDTRTRTGKDGSRRGRLFVVTLVGAVCIFALLLASTSQASANLTPAVAATSAGSPLEPSVLRSIESSANNYAGSWIDDNGRVQVRVVAGSSTTMAREAAAGIKMTVRADAGFTYAELTAAMSLIDNASFTAAHGIVSVFVDELQNQVAVTAFPTRMAEAQRAVDRIVGKGLAVVGPGQMTFQQSGPDRYRDRYPYTGASSISLGPSRSGATRKRCSTAFPLQRSGHGKSFMLTAAHCTEGWEGAWTGSGYSPNEPFQENPYAFTSSTAALTVWTNYIGTNVGYADSVCPSRDHPHRLFTCSNGSTGYSSTEYSIVGAFPGDVAVVRVAGVEPYMWTDRNVRSPIYYAQESDPMNGDTTLCFSGQTTGNWCGLTVRASNVSSWSCSNTACATNPTDTNRHYIQGRVMATKSRGTCTKSGDSGGAIYKPARSPSGAAGAIRAVGVHNGSSAANYCTVFFTPVWRAVKLFAAPVAHK